MHCLLCRPRMRHATTASPSALPLLVAAVLLLSGLAALPAVAEPGAQPLQIRVDLPRAAEEVPAEVFVRLAPSAEGVAAGLEEQQLRKPLEDDRLLRVALPAAGEWTVCLWAAGFWAPCERLALESVGEEPILLPMALWPSGTVRGTVALPEEEDGAEKAEAAELPEWVRLGFAPSDRHVTRTGSGAAAVPTARSLPESESRCRVEPSRENPRKAAWTCSLPAGRVDLQVRPVGFVPAYRWDVEVPPGDEVDLGEVVLVKGSSVAGSVEVVEGRLDPERCVVFLSPMVAGGSESPRTAQRLAEGRFQASVGERGFFQVTGVPEGTYVLRAEQPGLAPGHLSPVEVWEDMETVLREPVVLRPPLDLEVRVVPAEDWMGGRWKVTAMPAQDFAGRIEVSRRLEETVDESGRAAFPGLAPGLYRVQVFDSSGQSFHSDRNVLLENPADGELQIEIPMVLLEGEIFLGDEPLPATLWFGGRHGAFQAELVSDEEGRFVGALPKPGRWRVEVEAPEEGISNRVRVDVEPDREGDADVRIELPDTRVFGTVVDVAGRPVPEVDVHVQSGNEGAADRTDPEGRFEVRAFPPGPASVLANKRTPRGTLQSDTRLMQVAEDRPYGPLQLVVRATRTLRGRVETPTGRPIPGAVVWVSTHRPRTSPLPDSDRTGADGTFEVEVREDTEVLQAIVQAPGHALTAMEVPAEEPLVVRPKIEGGVLAIDMDESLEHSDFRTIVFQEGLSLPFHVLITWSRSQGSVPEGRPGTPLRIPAMAAGNYRMCIASMIDLTTAVLETGDQAEGLASCEQGFLNPGGELLLKVSPPDPGQSKGDES